MQRKFAMKITLHDTNDVLTQTQTYKQNIHYPFSKVYAYCIRLLRMLKQSNAFMIFQ